MNISLTDLTKSIANLEFLQIIGKVVKCAKNSKNIFTPFLSFEGLSCQILSYFFAKLVLEGGVDSSFN